MNSARETVFDQEVRMMREAGTFKGVKDSKKPLRFIITEDHIRIAKRGDQSECVIAQAVAESQVRVTHLSVGETITKVLYDDGWVYRFVTTPALKKALDQFDKTGEWPLPPGSYKLPPPRNHLALHKNQSKEQQERRDERWQKFRLRHKQGASNGEGIRKHRSRPIESRQITVVKN